MSKTSRKGYYVEGVFVPEQPDAEAGPPSRTARKRASEELQKLGERLAAARPALVDGLALPERLREAIIDARSMTSQGAKRRQRQYIGKLMRTLSDDEIAAIRAALERAV